MFSSPLFTGFLKISQDMTLATLGVLIASFAVVRLLEKRKLSFSARMGAGLGMGFAIGLLVQVISGFPDAAKIASTVWLQETITWYGFFGSLFVSFIRMLVFPIIITSLIHVIINLKSDMKISRLIGRALFWFMLTTGIATLMGAILAIITNLGRDMAVVQSDISSRRVLDLTGVLLGLIPSNPILAMNNNNVIGIVIFAAMTGSAARIMRSKEKYQKVMDVFADVIDASYRVVMSMAMTIIKFMPYGVVALMARTIISYGVPAIQQALLFITLIYSAALIMILIYSAILLARGLNPIIFYRKAIPALMMAFSSRSSIGTLPVTVSVLEDKMGVSIGTSNFVPSIGSTMGMNGCGGYFPGMVAVMIATMVGVPIDASFIVMVLIVAILGSFGIAGIPGSATMSISIMLAGIGLGEYYHLLALVLAIDPILDMARTMTNVNGTMIVSVCTDKDMGTLDIAKYNSMDVPEV